MVHKIISQKLWEFNLKIWRHQILLGSTWNKKTYDSATKCPGTAEDDYEQVRFYQLRNFSKYTASDFLQTLLLSSGLKWKFSTVFISVFIIVLSYVTNILYGFIFSQSTFASLLANVTAYRVKPHNLRMDCSN